MSITAKSELRERLLSVRSAMERSERASADSAITRRVCDQLTSWQRDATHAVFVYLARPDEVATAAIIEHCSANARPVAVPKIISKSEMRAVDFPGWQALTRGPLGLLSPRSQIATNRPVDIALIPGLGFTRAGARIGFGAGYYDRWLACNPDALRVGLAYRCQILESLPQQAHDIALDWLITDNGTFACPLGRIAKPDK